MSTFSEQINVDFIKRYQQLDALLADGGGIHGYLVAMERVSWYEKRGFPTFDADIHALKAMRLLYNRLTKTADLTAALACEDDVDYLSDLISRFENGCDPITRLKTEIPDENNADAKKNRAIEAEAREISSRSLAWQETVKKLALTSAACFAVGLGLLWKIKKGLHL